MEKNSFIFSFKKLPKAFLLALSIILVIHGVELFALPMNFFTFRVWEAIEVVKFHSSLLGPFYPNMHVSMVEEGDLGHHTKFAVKKKVEWQTDRYGYRKRNQDINKYNIVIVGGSNIAGSSLTQEDMLSEVLERELKTSTYPFATSEIHIFLNTERFMSHPPKIVILETIERNIHVLPPMEIQSKPIQLSWPMRCLDQFLVKHQSLAISLDRFSKFSVQRYAVARVKQALHKIQDDLTSLARKTKQTEQTTEIQKMLFFEGVSANRDVSAEEINKIVESIKYYNDLCKKKGIRFIYLPTPNKENIYYDYLPVKKKAVFLERLITKLKSENIEVVDTQRAFEEARNRQPDILLYDPDETHLNAYGIRVLASLLEKQLRKNMTVYN